MQAARRISDKAFQQLKLMQNQVGNLITDSKLKTCTKARKGKLNSEENRGENIGQKSTGLKINFSLKRHYKVYVLTEGTMDLKSLA